jgi:hypothetical protein
MDHEFLAPARAELDEAFDFYESQRPGLGAALTVEIEAAIAKILQKPTLWAKLPGDVRRCRLIRFPYALIYQIRGSLILIVAVAHLRRKPAYWRNRLGPERP